MAVGEIDGSGEMPLLYLFASCCCSLSEHTFKISQPFWPARAVSVDKHSILQALYLSYQPAHIRPSPAGSGIALSQMPRCLAMLVIPPVRSLSHAEGHAQLATTQPKIGLAVEFRALRFNIILS